MFLFTVAFLAGDVYLQSFAVLPSYLSILTIFALTTASYFYCRHKIILGLALGFVFTALYAHWAMSWTLPKAWEGKDLIVKGYIASLPVQDDWQTSFLFSTTELQLDETKQKIHTLIRLGWHNNQSNLKVGEEWQFVVHLKRIHSTENPAGFDYEAWSLQKGIRATGLVIKSEQNILLSSDNKYFMDRIRQNIQDKIKFYLADDPNIHWLLALIIGEREDFSQQEWQVLRNTGTNHLIAIAGLHIGMMVGLTVLIIGWLWRHLGSLSLIFPAKQAGICGGLVIAILYSALAGFSLPTQRAGLMCIIFTASFLLRRNFSIWNVWALAMLIILLLNPLSILTESFWLSFGTIALIIYGMSGRLVTPNNYWWHWGRAQLVIGLGLIPLTLYFFQQCSIISFVANSIAIPWLGLLILPLIFVGTLFLYIWPLIGKWVLLIVSKNLSALYWLLAYLAHFQFATLQIAIPTISILITTIIGCLLLLAPINFLKRFLGMIWLLPLFLYQPIKPIIGEFFLTLLDVGQGLSVVVQTQKHFLVYDTGAKFANMDMGESVVLPYLRLKGAKTIDKLVISHGDNDHMGGTSALLNALSIKSVETSVPEKISGAQTCLAGEHWAWDGVDFDLIYPSQHELHYGNDSSCVLRVSNGQQSVLLTGDMEKYAEKTLLERNQLIATDILVAPHHGSKTSGLFEFVSAVHPKYVLFATGYRNRYHFPHPSVVATYHKINAMQLNTVNTGAMQFDLNPNTNPTASFYRESQQKYWYDR